jgi:hypothetical protein
MKSEKRVALPFEVKRNPLVQPESADLEKLVV